MIGPFMVAASPKRPSLLLTAPFALAMVSAFAAHTVQAAEAQSPSSGTATSFVPSSFKVPTLVEAGTFRLVPLGPDVVKVDFDAYMSSIDHLQKTFTRSTEWPHKGISAADAMLDMETEQARFRNRVSFAYSVLTPDGRRERGCVYVAPSPVKGYDAVVRIWVTKKEYDAGFDADLYRWVVDWVRKDWPFAKVAYPGHAIEWSGWDALVAQNKAALSGT